MFGREAKLPVQTSLPKIETSGWQTTMKSYLADFLDRMAAYQKQAAINRARYQLKMVTQHDKRLLTPLKPGTMVLRKVPNQCLSKLDIPRDGPWLVEGQREKEGEKLPVYKLKNDQNKTILAHREALSPFVEPIFEEKQPESKAKQMSRDTHSAHATP